MIHLTKTEKKVINCIFNQRIISSRKIADSLESNPRTIDQHIFNLMKKFNVNLREDLIDAISAEYKIKQSEIPMEWFDA